MRATSANASLNNAVATCGDEWYRAHCGDADSVIRPGSSRLSEKVNGDITITAAIVAPCARCTCAARQVKKSEC